MQSTVGFVKSRKLIKEIPMAHKGYWSVIWTPFLLCISLRMLNRTIGVGSIGSMQLTGSVLSFQVSVAMPYYSIVMVSIGSSSGS